MSSTTSTSVEDAKNQLMLEIKTVVQEFVPEITDDVINVVLKRVDSQLSIIDQKVNNALTTIANEKATSVDALKLMESELKKNLQIEISTILKEFGAGDNIIEAVHKAFAMVGQVDDLWSILSKVSKNGITRTQFIAAILAVGIIVGSIVQILNLLGIIP